jgi:hypothetical protein
VEIIRLKAQLRDKTKEFEDLRRIASKYEEDKDEVVKTLMALDQVADERKMQDDKT